MIYSRKENGSKSNKCKYGEMVVTLVKSHFICVLRHTRMLFFRNITENGSYVTN